MLLVTAIVAFAATGTARAEEPRGCDGFKWPPKVEAALLQAPGTPHVASGSAAAIDSKAVDLDLVAYEAAKLPMVPDRAPKMSPSKAGFLQFAAPKNAGPYQLTVSQAVWIDVIQDGHTVRPSAFSGALDCPGMRKSLHVTLAAAPFILQISGTAAPSVGIVTMPVP